MKKQNARIVVSLACGLLAPLMAWLAGYDFDKRGPEAVFTMIGVLFLFVACYTFPGWYQR